MVAVLSNYWSKQFIFSVAQQMLVRVSSAHRHTIRLSRIIQRVSVMRAATAVIWQKPSFFMTRCGKRSIASKFLHTHTHTDARMSTGYWSRPLRQLLYASLSQRHRWRVSFSFSSHSPLLPLSSGSLSHLMHWSHVSTLLLHHFILCLSHTPSLLPFPSCSCLENILTLISHCVVAVNFCLRLSHRTPSNFLHHKVCLE